MANFAEKINTEDFKLDNNDYLVLATDGVCSAETLLEQEIKDIILQEDNLDDALLEIVKRSEDKQKGGDMGIILINIK
ncbi:MAG: hypothetical protein ABEJ24_02255 [Candidatus Magasanikbacteria bacterium]